MTQGKMLIAPQQHTTMSEARDEPGSPFSLDLETNADMADEIFALLIDDHPETSIGDERKDIPSEYKGNEDVNSPMNSKGKGVMDNTATTKDDDCVDIHLGLERSTVKETVDGATSLSPQPERNWFIRAAACARIRQRLGLDENTYKNKTVNRQNSVGEKGPQDMMPPAFGSLPSRSAFRQPELHCGTRLLPPSPSSSTWGQLTFDEVLECSSPKDARFKYEQEMFEPMVLEPQYLDAVGSPPRQSVCESPLLQRVAKREASMSPAPCVKRAVTRSSKQ